MATLIGKGKGKGKGKTEGQGKGVDVVACFRTVNSGQFSASLDYKAPPEKDERKRKTRGRIDYDFNLYFFPTPLHHFLREKQVAFFDIEKPRYVGFESPPLNLTIGKRLEVDVATWLSNHKTNSLVRYDGTALDVDSLHGKYLLICCFFVPIPADSYDARYCRAMIAAYPDLYRSNLFEMVMVAKMRSDFLVDDNDEKAAFAHFFSAFACPAIPFSDVLSRDLVCHSLGLGLNSPLHTALLLDPYQTVLLTDAVPFLDYGASCYPFTDLHLNSLLDSDDDMKCRLDVNYKYFFCCEIKSKVPLPQDVLLSRSVPLEELLCCDSSSLLCNFGSDGLRKISVSDLSRTYCIAFYLCYDGHFLNELANFHWRCLQKNLELEIVLVYLPFTGEPTYFFDSVKLALKKLHISSWWELPFVDHVSRRLWRLCEQAPGDNVIIWADGGKAGDLKGREMIRYSRPYPFTRKHILKDKLSRLEALTPESLLGGFSSYLVYTNCFDKIMHVSDLKGKNILLYLEGNDQFCSIKKLLLNCYEKIGEDYPGTQVVFVPVNPLNITSRRDVNQLMFNIPWLILPVPANQVFRQMFDYDCVQSTLIAIGAEGRICSRYARDRLDPYGVVPLFADTLFKEIVDALCEFVSLL